MLLIHHKTGSPHLPTALFKSYDSAEKVGIQPVLTLVAAAVFLWVNDYNLGTLQLVCISDGHSIPQSCDCYLQPSQVALLSDKVASPNCTW